MQSDDCELLVAAKCHYWVKSLLSRQENLISDSQCAQRSKMWCLVPVTPVLGTRLLLPLLLCLEFTISIPLRTVTLLLLMRCLRAPLKSLCLCCCCSSARSFRLLFSLTPSLREFLFVNHVLYCDPQSNFYYHRYFIIKIVLFVICGAFRVLPIFPWILRETQGPKTMNGAKFPFESLIAKRYSI